MKLQSKLAALALPLLMSVAGNVLAAAPSLNFDFASPSGTLGTSQIYGSGSVSITAYGFDCGTQCDLAPASITPTALYGKNSGGDEVGLGINRDPDHEISFTQFVQLDLTSLCAATPAHLALEFGSTNLGSTNEPWKVFGSNTLGQLGTQIATGTQEVPNFVDFSSLINSYTYFGITTADGAAGNHNVLLAKITTAVPEPDSSALLLAGFGLLGFVARRSLTRLSA